MSFRVDCAGRRVLVLDGSARSLGAITSLLAEGARVTVRTATPDTSVQDLAERELITIDPAASTEGWHLVLDPTSSTNVAAPALDSEHRGGARPGTVVLVGGGPGDPGLITVAGLAAVRAADVIVVDRLAPLAVLEQAARDAEIVDVGKIPRGRTTSQQRINQILIDRATAGRAVVRLKGGDSFVFGRGGEEVQACAEAGVPVTVIPGVTSATAAPALAGIPLTHRTLVQGFTVVSGHVRPGEGSVDWAALAAGNTTLVVLMGVSTLAAIAAALQEHGLAPGTPAAVVADAGLPSMRTVYADLESVARRSADAGIRSPAVVVIGAVAGFPASAPVTATHSTHRTQKFTSITQAHGPRP